MSRIIKPSEVERGQRISIDGREQDVLADAVWHQPSVSPGRWEFPVVYVPPTPHCVYDAWAIPDEHAVRIELVAEAGDAS